MKTRSLLVRVPGYPFDPRALLPSRGLAAAAGCLLDAGHETRILDYGTLETLDRLFPDELRGSVERVSDQLFGRTTVHSLSALHILWKIRATDRAFRQRLSELCESVAGTLAAEKALDFVALELDTADDYPVAVGIARRLRAARPGVKLVALGRLADLFAEELLGAADEFDCACIGDTEMAIAALAEDIKTPARWRTIPNLAYRRAGGVRATARRHVSDLAGLPAPAYETDVYPALGTGQKLMLFSLEDSRGCGRGCCACPRADTGNPPRLRPPESLCDAMWRLGALHGARAFRIDSPGTPWHHAEAVARRLMRRGMDVTYSRANHVFEDTPPAFDTLSASGCRAASFRLDTGSQRLLDNHYGRGFTVSQVERSLRACKAAGILAMAEFTYPCPEDDHHTRAETLRLVDRTRPDAVHVALPEIHPHTAWYECAASFGFRLRRQDYFRQVTRCRTRFPLSPNRWPWLPYETSEMSNGQAIASHAELVSTLRESGTCTFPEAGAAFIAPFSGQMPLQSGTGDAMYRKFLEGDTVALAGLVDDFNRAACVPTRTVAFRPTGTLPRAVGN
jgi:radical SAM superfamily enzyme YgiQ (UPF0313 family)